MDDEMTSPDHLAKQFRDTIGTIPEPSVAPVEKWNPDFSGEMDMRIARNGDWFYKGNKLARAALVKLFSTILRKDDDGHYYLVTPVEKFRITVEDAPFVAHSLEREGEGRDQLLWLTTNVGERIPIDGDHPLEVSESPDNDEPSPYICVRRNLHALVERQTFYELAALAQPGDVPGSLGIYSAGKFFLLGKAE